MRRIAWKQWRSCSADSLSMCPDSLASMRARRMDALAAGAQHRRDRVLRQPVDLEIGMQPAQLVGDRHVAARMAEPDRRGDVERALAARPSAHPARAPARGRSAKSRSSRLTLTGSRTCGPWPEPSSITRSRAGHLGERDPAARSGDASLGALDDERGGSCTRAASSRASRRRSGPPVRGDERLGRRLETPAHAVLDRLGRVRLGEHLREEELEEAAVVPQPVVAVVLRPALVGVELLVPRIDPVLAATRRAARRGR